MSLPSFVDAAKPFIEIENGEGSVIDVKVDITLDAPMGTKEMRLSNSRSSLSKAQWQPFLYETTWKLTEKRGTKTVYVQFRHKDGTISNAVSDRIFLAIEEVPGVVINDGDSVTEQRKVRLSIVPPVGANTMRIANGEFLETQKWISTAESKSWTLSWDNGMKYVRVQFRYKDGTKSAIYQDGIKLKVPPTPIADFSINDEDKEVDGLVISLSFKNVVGYTEVRVSNTSDMAFAVWGKLPSSRSLRWVLSPGFGNKKVFVEFKGRNAKSVTVNKSIVSVDPKRILSAGMLVRSQNSPVYYVGRDGDLHSFTNPSVFLSWYSYREDIALLPESTLWGYRIGNPVCLRAGTWLVQFPSSARVFAVEPGCILRPIRSEIEAYLLFGSSWEDRVLTFDSSEASQYEVREYLEDGIVDVDRDGLDLTTEIVHGTKDTAVDSDQDGLSDAEEVYIWKSDPTKKDTNDDGLSDGQHVLNHTDPVTGGILTVLPKDGYMYPQGSILSTKDKKTLFYVLRDNSAHPFSSSGIIKNEVNSIFSIHEPISASVNTKGRSIISGAKEQMVFPTTLGTDGHVILQ